VLDSISDSDPSRKDAEELRAVIQRRLLEASRLNSSPAAATGVPAARAPRPSKPLPPPPAQ